MKKFAALLLFAIVACSSPKSDEATKELLDPVAFNEKLQSEVVLLDVRTSEEYADGHISGSANIDFKDPAFADKVSLLDKTKEYAVYCAGGVRSAKAAEIMKANGFTKVVTLEGGIKNWKEKGMPVE